MDRGAILSWLSVIPHRLWLNLFTALAMGLAAGQDGMTIFRLGGLTLIAVILFAWRPSASSDQPKNSILACSNLLRLPTLQQLLGIKNDNLTALQAQDSFGFERVQRTAENIAHRAETCSHLIQRCPGTTGNN